MSELAKEHPQELPKGSPTLGADEVATLGAETPGWEASEDKLTRTLEFKDFSETMGFVTRLALLAEAEGHHPDISISWNRLDLAFWTHTAEGLTRNDFIMAARVNRLLGE